MDKTVTTTEVIILPNPDCDDQDFRHNNKGEINITGTVKHGNGVEERRGLLRGSGRTIVYDYLFDKKKYTIKSAREWLDKYMEVNKTMNSNDILNKSFDFTMPLQKGYDGDDGHYHIQFAISTAAPDKQDDQMTENALNSMLKQIKGINVDGSQLSGINIDDDHKTGLKSIIGPATAAWIDESKKLWVDARVRKEWEPTIRDLEESGAYLGGSIRGRATKVLKNDGTGIRKVDDVFLVRAALTDTPAAWDTRRRASDVIKDCPMCTQILKSLEGDDDIQKGVIDLSNTFEQIRHDVNDALDTKYGVMTMDGYIDRKCWLRDTTPDFIVVVVDGGELYQIPYTREADYTGEMKVNLDNPVRADNQLITKALNESIWMFKSDKPTNFRGDNLTDGDVTIPEGVDLDKSVVEKIKALPTEGRDFIKGLLGLDSDVDPDGTGDPGGEPGATSNQEPKPIGGEPMQKNMISKNDVKKMIDDKTGELQKKINEVEEENKSLKKRLDTKDSTDDEKIKKSLLMKSLGLYKKLNKDMTPEEESNLVKEIKEDLDKENGTLLVERDIKSMTKALEQIPAHDMPFMNDNMKKSIADKHAQEAADIRKDIDGMGREE